MKLFGRIVLVAVAAMSATSCGGRAVERLESERDSLMVIVGAKDSLLNAVFADINAITANLAEIKTREKLISDVNIEGETVRPAEQISQDIAAIDRLLKENKEKLAALQRKSSQLRQANLKIDELDKTIASLTERLDTQSGEIKGLREELERRGVEVVELTEQVAARTAEVEERDAQLENLSGEKRQMENRMNAVYYIVGSEKELRDAQILDRQGRATSAGNKLESFVAADARLLTEVEVNHRRATLRTSHPEGSYRLVENDKEMERLVIVDAERFWEASKILIISYK